MSLRMNQLLTSYPMIFLKVVQVFHTEESDKLVSDFGHIDKGNVKRVLWWHKYGSTGLKQA